MVPHVLKSIPDYEMKGPLPYPQSAMSTISISVLFGALLALGLHSIFGEAPLWVPAVVISLALMTLLIHRVAQKKRGSEQSSPDPDVDSMLQTFCDRVPTMLGILELQDSDMLHIYDNPTACRFFGVLPGDTRGKTTSELQLSSDLIKLWIEKCKESQRQNAPIEFEFQCGGSPDRRTFRAIVCLTGESENKYPIFCYMAGEISDLKRTEASLQKTRERLESTVHAAHLGLWDWDIPSGRVIFDGCWASMLGYETQGVSQHISAWETLVHPDDRPLVRRALNDHISGQTPEYTCEYRIQKKDGSWIWALDCGRIVERESNGTPLRALGILQDISEAHSIKEELQQSSKRKDEFLATLAHELRNPLAPLRTGLQILKKDPSSPQASEARAMMDRQLCHMVRLIDDLLDVSRITRGALELRREIVSLNQCVETAIESSKPFIDRANHRLSVVCDSGPLMMEGDPARLSQVVSNLLINSAKYTPPGGTISLTVSKESEEAIIKVSDNGVGIPSDMLDAIFEMFGQVNRTLDRSTGGLGIGLALVKRFVELHGGYIRAESAGVGKGSTFSIRLPLLRKDQGLIPDGQGKPGSAHEELAMKNILIVDDNVDGAASLAMYLEMLGHHVLVAHDGPQALEAIKKEMPPIILLDIGLPGMSGYELAHTIRALPQGDKPLVVAITGWGTDEDKKKTADAGCNIHLTKPVDLDELGRLIA